MINEKTSQLANEAGITKGIAHTLLLKNSWDNNKALDLLKDPNYVQKTFNFPKAEYEIKEVEMNDGTFTCGCCYCECDIATEAIVMEDCGHMLCTDCFPMYC